MKRRMREFEYRVFFWRSVVTIELSEERLAGFKLCSGREIPDYRDEEYR